MSARERLVGFSSIAIGRVAHLAELADDEGRVVGLERALDDLPALVADLVGEGRGHQARPARALDRAGAGLPRSCTARSRPRG